MFIRRKFIPPLLQNTCFSESNIRTEKALVDFFHDVIYNSTAVVAFRVGTVYTTPFFLSQEILIKYVNKSVYNIKQTKYLSLKTCLRFPWP